MYCQLPHNVPSVTRALKDDDVTRIRGLYNPPHIWNRLEANFLGELAVVLWAAERVGILVRGLDNAVFQKTWKQMIQRKGQTGSH